MIVSLSSFESFECYFVLFRSPRFLWNIFDTIKKTVSVRFAEARNPVPLIHVGPSPAQRVFGESRSATPRCSYQTPHFDHTHPLLKDTAQLRRLLQEDELVLSIISELRHIRPGRQGHTAGARPIICLWTNPTASVAKLTGWRPRRLQC